MGGITTKHSFKQYMHALIAKSDKVYEMPRVGKIATLQKTHALSTVIYYETRPYNNMSYICLYVIPMRHATD